ncbi:hypothetical protein H6S82_16990 [Planktothrix sp. FACHB-1355]|uniref:Uncharacterized protein n=1 Tax=Aerosakkonema funiforme FACHB-1375 TaxID=2949571 RepID=A0A926ZG89_9CYAN|nr:MULTISPECIES: hypothetical protein [Oscillatoriales]MBD2181479.1 hypothetical protein [Aerosakkonema funiforme FACHB-1375]MBD3560534.1 hypothetical protein [Planktothrix sp. FACHB-1355]
MNSLIVIALLVTYVGGVWKFWTGFEKTNFNRNLTTRLSMSMLWPFLLVNKSYRKNFTKALKG